MNSEGVAERRKKSQYPGQALKDVLSASPPPLFLFFRGLCVRIPSPARGLLLGQPVPEGSGLTLVVKNPKRAEYEHQSEQCTPYSIVCFDLSTFIGFSRGKKAQIGLSVDKQHGSPSTP